MNTQTEPKNKGRPRQFDREQALHQALLLFWQKGYEQTSISDLCSEMKINPPSLYAAFGSKKDLFFLASEYYLRQYLDAVWAQIDVHADFSVAVQRFFQAATANMVLPNMPHGCMILSQTRQVDDPDVQARLRDIREYAMSRFRNRIQRAVNDKQLKSNTNIELLATLLLVYVEGLSSYAYWQQGDLLDVAARHSVALLRDFQAA